MVKPEIVSTEDLDAVIQSIGGDEAVVDTEFARFLQPTQKDIEDLAARWEPGIMVYGSIAHDWPLCYDFAEECASFVRGGAYRRGWKMRPAFGVLRYTKNALAPETDEDGNETGNMVNTRHAICFVVLDTCHIRYFEPQTGAWMEQPVDCKSMDSWDI